jgi:hypothetical protein
MNDEKNEKPPNEDDCDTAVSPFERFESLARRLLRVPREEINRLEDDEDLTSDDPQPQEA